MTISADINSVAGTGFDLAASVFRNHPKTPIIILVDQLSYDSVIQAFRCGARGVFEQRESMSEFAHCVEHVKNGYIWVGKAGTDFLIEALGRMPAPCGKQEMICRLLPRVNSRLCSTPPEGRQTRPLPANSI